MRTRRTRSFSASTSSRVATARRRRERVAEVLRGEHLDLGVGVHVAEREAHREAVHLRFRQRIGAAELHRVLRRDHEEQLVHRVRAAFHRHLALGHHLEQRRLRARRARG